ncbi:hypothetical protein PszF2a_36360 [Stutzerimonas stutzeri]|jgi:hypothetical protein|nr:hypothetical protein PszF2a_36360 [Stutzerimonas stutzeri]
MRCQGKSGSGLDRAVAAHGFSGEAATMSVRRLGQRIDHREPQ